MTEVQIIPFSGRTHEFDCEGVENVRFPSSEQGFLLGQENGILEPLIQEIIDGRIVPERLPILLYGIVGTGRTHLLKGLLETWRKNQASEAIRRQSCYLSCADFIRQYNEAVASRTTDEFRRRYNRTRLLLLDDLEQLLGKPTAQLELRLLLDDFAGITVLTAQSLPNDMRAGKVAPLSIDLVERIQSGTTIPVLPPGKAVRLRFLRDLASALRIPFTESLLNMVSNELTGTIPQLYAAVAQKYGESKTVNGHIDIAFWQQFSKKRQPRNTQDLAAIAKMTATYFSLKLNDLKGQSRSKAVAHARSLAVYLAKTQLCLTFKVIGHFFGKRDSSTVRHLFEKVQNNLQKDMELRDHLFRLQLRLENLYSEHRSQDR